MLLKKKGKLLKFVGALVFAASVASLSPIASSAAKGNWVGSSTANSISIMSSSKPDKHWATYDYKDMSSYLAKRVVAHTDWKGMYHCSRARLESSLVVSKETAVEFGVWIKLLHTVVLLILQLR